MPEMWRKSRKDKDMSMAYDHVKGEWLPASEVPKRHYFPQTDACIMLFETRMKLGDDETAAAIVVLECLTKKERIAK
jgi:hypothetical protein